MTLLDWKIHSRTGECQIGKSPGSIYLIMIVWDPKKYIEPKFLHLLHRHWGDLDDFGYYDFEIPKRSGGVRLISAPKPFLKIVHRTIYHSLLKHFKFHFACHGFAAKKSIRTNAEEHVRKDVVLRLDIKNFFPSIKAKRVYGVLKSLGLDDKYALYFITRVCTRHNSLPQGAPTSPSLANLVCRSLDSRLGALCQSRNFSYSRYADDLTFSGQKSIVRYITIFKNIIDEEGFIVNDSKTRIMRRGARQEVTGITVNDKIGISRNFRRTVRSSIHRVNHKQIAFIKNKKVDIENILGYISYIKSINIGQYKSLACHLENSF